MQCCRCTHLSSTLAVGPLASAARTTFKTRTAKRRAMPDSSPKLDLHGWNTEKPPDEWVSGDHPITGAQASYLRILCEEAKVEAPPCPAD